MPSSSYLVDTNVLLRLVQPDSPEHGIMRQCTDLLWEQGADLFYTSQNLAEFWNVCTRPADRNGFGFSISEADERAGLIEAKLNFAPDSEATHREWRRIVVADGVSGVQVHDARLVAAMHVHRIENILTLNTKDFRRFSDILVIAPQDVLAEKP
ncbi:MAG TPA: PIN domain-containing protein [Acidobacteriaceae bacterium]